MWIVSKPIETGIHVQSCDTIPFKFLSKDPQLCKGKTFVDVDYEKVLREKCAVIRDTEALFSLCKDVKQEATKPHVLFESKQYVAVAADLHWLGDLQDLQQAIAIGNKPVLFLAEVSMVYMDPNAVANLIRWASSFKNGNSELSRVIRSEY